MSVLVQSNDNDTQHLILESLQQFYAHPQFSKWLYTIIKKQISPALDCSILYNFLRVICKTLSVRQDLCTEFLSIVAQLLDWIALGQRTKCKRFRLRALDLIQSALTKQSTPVIVDGLFSSVFESKDHPRQGILIGLVFRALKKHQILQSHIPTVLERVLKTMILSKTPIPSAYVTPLQSFFENWVDQELFDAHIGSQMEKALLRSPEVALSVLEKATLYASVDTSSLIALKATEQLLNQFKSKNQVIRDDAVSLFRVMAQKASDPQSKLSSTQLIIKSFSKAPTPEARMAAFQALEALKSLETAPSVLEALPTLLVKETADALVSACFSCYQQHLESLLKSNDGQQFVAFLLKQTQDPKQVMRKFSLLALEQLAPLLKPDLAPDFVQIVDQVQQAGISLLDPKKDAKSLIEGLCALSIVLQISSAESLLTAQSFLLNDKLFKLLVHPNEQAVFARCVLGMLKYQSLVHEHVGLYADALIWLVVYPDHSVRKQVLQSLDHQDILVKAVRLGAGKILKQELKPDLSLTWGPERTQSSEKIGVKLLGLLRAVLQNATEQSLVEMFVLCCHPILVEQIGHDLWVRLCFRAKRTPQLLVNHSRLIQDWIQGTEHETLGGLQVEASFKQATLNALSLCVQISPDTFLGQMMEHGLALLQDPAFETIRLEDVGIWKTPEDELYDDPLQVKQKAPTGKMTEEEKWEYDLKQKLQAQKKTPQTKQEKELVHQRRVLEKQVRERTQALFEKQSLGLQLVQTILHSVVSDISQESVFSFAAYVGRVENQLLQILVREQQEGAGVVSSVTSLSILKQLAGFCLKDTLNTNMCIGWLLLVLGVYTQFEGIPFSMKQLPFSKVLSDGLNQCAEMIKEFGTLEPLGFLFLFPLLESVVFKTGRVQSIKEKTHLELVLVCADILTAHCALDTLMSLYLPRQEMMQCLIALADRYPRLRVACKNSILNLTLTTANLEVEDGPLADFLEQLQDKVSALLIHALLNEETSVRQASLEALLHLPFVESLVEVFDVNVWMNRFDKEVGSDAKRLWEQIYEEAPLDKDLVKELCAHVTKNEQISSCAGLALADAFSLYPDTIAPSLTLLYTKYKELAADPVPELDDYGLVIPESLNKPDEWQGRAGIANALKFCVGTMNKSQVIEFFKFLIQEQALGDKSETVRRKMVDAGLAGLEAHGKQYTKDLLQLFDQYLDRPAEATEKHDLIREGVVILLGTLAQYLESSDNRVSSVLKTLIETLNTPSEVVQVAVGECLPGLIKNNKDQAPRLIPELFEQLFNSPKYGERRGAAYGIAGVAKGAGISSLKELQIMDQLKQAIEDKKNINKREGALFAFETLSYTMGRTFEPYVVQILPLLLICFGDGNRQIREAVQDTSRMIMSKLSAHAVKLVLPSLLAGLQDRQWRTKTASIEVMASMSALAPKQLGQSLPMIVPKICEALADSHQKVQDSAKEALKKFGEVIKNPEIQELVPVLISALVDPNNKTLLALGALLETTFIHYIDAASLALLVPIIFRGLNERSAETKRKAAQIMGNMASLTEERDLVPYLDTLVPSLKEVLVDPVPETRATSAKAFGAMVSKLGEERFPGLVTELIETLSSDTSNVDRSGAAQGLSEILAGCGIERLEALLPELLVYTKSAKSYTREGFTILMIYLPATFGESFTPYVAEIVPTVLNGLADEDEGVREAALKAGKVLVRSYARSSVKLLLPALEEGLFNENWRIRQNSVQLMGDLLFQISGASNKAMDDNDNDEGAGTESGRQALISALGEERFNSVLARIYIVRGDTSGIVRQASLHVWKAIVTNTPRTLKTIMPILMTLLMTSLASSSTEKRGVAARTLGDLVRKLGEAVLLEIIPILERGLDSDNEDTRQGACVGISEMMASAGKQTAEEFVVNCTPLIRRALIDSSANVRESAAQAFDILHQTVGPKAIDDILPTMLNELRSDTRGYALQGLKEMMAVKSNVVFPVLVPTLLHTPITVFNAQALASLISVAGNALNKRVETILSVLMDELDTSDIKDEILATIEVLLGSLEGADAVHQTMRFLQELLSEAPVQKQIVALQVLLIFFKNTNESLDAYLADWIVRLMAQLNNTNQEHLKANWNCLDQLVKRIKKDDMDKYISAVTRGIHDASNGLEDDENIAGFNLPKGISPILPILLQGLMYGEPSAREQASWCLGDVVKRTSEQGLKLYVTSMTGPLIRVAGDRFPAGVKTAILHALGLLLTKVSPMLKPFLPQLQRTFSKSLVEAQGTKQLREEAAKCLSLLIPLQARLDPLAVELVQGIRTAEDVNVRLAVWEAMYGLMSGVGKDKQLSEASMQQIQQLIMETLLTSGESDTQLRQAAAKCIGKFAPLGDQTRLVEQLLQGGGDDAAAVHGKLVALKDIYKNDVVEQVDGAMQLALSQLDSDKTFVSLAAIGLVGMILQIDTSFVDEAVRAFAKLMAPSSNADTKREAIVVVKQLAKNHLLQMPHLKELVPVLMASVRDRTIPVKLAAERALVHCLAIKQGTKRLDEFLTLLDASQAQTIGDYCKRVLIKIAGRDSDDES
ncbi:armadillo-type protein [Gorgonomyces haynaldii]|nr:armadillo-type protein [Gorgonomyces haynaldii]